MHEDFAVDGGLEYAAVVFQLSAQGCGVGEIAVVREGELDTVSHAYEQRLGIAQLRFARSGVAHMSYGSFACEMFQVFLAEYVGHKPHAHMQMAGAVPFIP